MWNTKKEMKEKELHKGTVPFLICKDYLVSEETYEVMLNPHMEMLVTSPMPADMDRYYDSKEYLSHNNSKNKILNVIYNTVKKQSFKRKYSLFLKKSTHKNILDVGAGTGDFLLFCKEKGFHVSGVEPNKNARKKSLEKGIKLHETIDSLSNQSYDVITLWHALEHVPNLYECIGQLKELLKPNGKLIVAVPNYKSFDAEYYKEYWAAYDTPRHLWHFSQQSVHLLFESFQMKVVNVYPMKFDSFYVSLLSEKYKTGKQNFLKAFWIGWQSNLKASKTSEYSSLIYEIKHQ